MPPEPLPWDRKDFFRERKPDRSESFGSLNRWRDSSHHGSREFGRWGSPDYRRPPGHGKQGGWHLFPEEFGHGYRSRSSEKMTEDDSFHSISRVEGKYGRHSRDNRGSYCQRDWKSHSWENNNGSTSTLARAHDVNNEQRSREDIATYSSHSNSDFGNICDQLQLKEQHDKLGGCNGFETVQKSERESSLSFNDWKPLKWTRSGSLSSRGSGFSHCSSSKSIGATDSNEAKVELLIHKESLVQSPSVDAAACMTSATPSEDVTSRKKPRLGWGEGLAKFEKTKVEGPNVSLNKDGAVFVFSNHEPVHSVGSTLVDRSPTLMGLPDCVSPATPSSVACSFSPGMEEKSLGKILESDISNLCGSPGPLSQNHFQGPPFKLEKLDFDLMANIGSSLMELLQSDEQCSLEPDYVRSTAINKLLLWKGEITKALEVTEAEIDYLENELKSVSSDTGSSFPLPATSSSLPAGDDGKLRNNQDFVTNSVSRPAPLQIDASGETISEKIAVCSGNHGNMCSNAKVEDIDSPGTVTSKLVESLSMMNTGSSEGVDHGAGYLETTQLTKREEKYLMPVSEGEKTCQSTYDDGSLKTDGEKCADFSSASLCKDREEIIVDNILASNKESANEANELLINLLPQNQLKAELSGVSNASFWQDDSLIREKFAKRKRLLKFKERVITLKFKAFQHLWKEDMHLLSLKKYRLKSQKKFELSLRTVQNGHQKHRSSIRTRSPVPGNLGIIPTAEIINCTKKFLLDHEPKLYRNTLRMPSQILDEEVSRFISSNGLIEDPFAVEKERAMINPWTQEERDVFMDKLATFGKDFRKIASFLDHKSTADCVEFYYKNHKSEPFKKTKKLNTNKQGKASNNIYLMPSGKRWNREISAASLDILGTASVMVAHAGNSIRNRQTYSRRLFLGGCRESKKSWDDDGNADEPCNPNVLGNERETVAADVLAGICGSLSSEAMSSCITSSVAPGEDWKCQKVDSVAKRPLTPEVTDNVDDETCSDESYGEMDPTDWTDEERSVFMQAVSSYGRDFERISQCIRTKSRDQCKVFFSKSRKCLGLDSLQPGTINGRASVAGDTDGGGSGSEDGCLLETSSCIYNNKLGSKMDEDLPSIKKINHVESYPAGPMNLQTALSRSDEIHGGKQIDHKDAGTLEPQALDSFQNEDQAKIVSDGGSNIINDLDKQFESLPVQKSEVIFANADAGRENAAEQIIIVAESVPVCEGNDPEVPNPESFVGMKPVDGVSTNFSRSDEIHGAKQIDHKYEQTLDPLASDAYQSENKIVSDHGSNTINDLDKRFESLPMQKSEVIFANVDAGRDDAAEQKFFVPESMPVCEGNDLEVLNPESLLGMKPVDGVSSNEFENKLKQSDHKQNVNTCGQSLKVMVHESNSTGSPSCLAADINSCSGLRLESDYQHKVSVELNSLGKPGVMLLPQDTSLATTNCMLQGCGVTQCEEAPADDKLSSTLDFQEHRDRTYSSVQLRGPALINESSQVLRGYPLHNPIKKVINGDTSCINLPDVQSIPKTERNVNGQFVTKDYHLQKCNSSNPQHSLISFPLKSQKMEHAINPPNSHSQSFSDSEKPSRTGDVKLFGQILSNPSSLPMENSSIHANEEKETHRHKTSNKTSNLKFTINNSDGNSGISKFDHNDYLGFENIPSRNYTFWDPNRRQNAYSSLPDSAILLAKYPAAFSNYPASSANIEHQQLKGTVKSNDWSINGVSVFPAREISGNSAVIDYQVCRSQDGSKPFMVDVKEHPDVLPEMQRHNKGYETQSGLQQQGSGMVGVNVVGRGEIIVGGSCTGVSDPVAAIKMHYARSQFGAQDKGIIRDDESWRGGKGDVGR